MTERTRQSGGTIPPSDDCSAREDRMFDRSSGVPQPVTNGCAMGPLEIRLFKLIAAKHAILLESKGMRHSRLARQGGVRGLWAKHYGMAKNTKADVVIAAIQKDIDELKSQLDQLELPL